MKFGPKYYYSFMKGNILAGQSIHPSDHGKGNGTADVFTNSEIVLNNSVSLRYPFLPKSALLHLTIHELGTSLVF